MPAGAERRVCGGWGGGSGGWERDGDGWGCGDEFLDYEGFRGWLGGVEGGFLDEGLGDGGEEGGDFRVGGRPGEQVVAF